MDITEYKNAMASIEMKKFTVEELCDQMKHDQMKKNNLKISAAAGAMIFVLIFAFLIGTFPQNHKVIITVYAGSQKMALSEKKRFGKIEASVFNEQYEYASDTGVINAMLSFQVEAEGKEIRQVSLRISEEEITRQNLPDADAYFFKISHIKDVDALTFAKEMADNDIFLWSLRNPETKETTYAELSGNTCILRYDQQEEAQYGLALYVKKEDNGAYSNEEVTVNAAIEYADGCKEYKKIKIGRSEDILSGLEITML